MLTSRRLANLQRTLTCYVRSARASTAQLLLQLDITLKGRGVAAAAAGYNAIAGTRMKDEKVRARHFYDATSNAQTLRLGLDFQVPQKHKPASESRQRYDTLVGCATLVVSVVIVGVLVSTIVKALVSGVAKASYKVISIWGHLLAK